MVISAVTTLYIVLTLKLRSATPIKLPSSFTADVTPNTVFPLSDFPAETPPKSIDLIPISLRVCNSSFSDIPLPLLSIQIFKSSNFASLASIMPSSLESKSARASKPSLATVPSDFKVLSPNNSVPSSIIPLLLISLTRRPSPFSIHAVFSAKPSLL